jgi:molecular chaperone IbpA
LNVENRLPNSSAPGANRARLGYEGAGSLPAHLTPKLLQKEDLEMRNNFDFTPYRRSTVGFDRLFDMIESARADISDTWPPFNLEKDGEEGYRITLAVAGFRPDEIEIVAQQNQLTVTGRKEDKDGDDDRYLHRGISARSFERRFQLADYIQVRSADFDNGLLSISLEREIPEAMKPRKIEIGSGSAQRQLGSHENEQRKAA